MKAGSHRRTTALAYDLMKTFLNETGIEDNSSVFLIGSARGVIIDKSVETDALKDVELVDVEYGRDNPHKNTAADYNDDAHHTTNGINHTGFNHMIDIRKGEGLYDDFDGYSYNRGSASVEQYQWFSEEALREILKDGIEDAEEFFVAGFLGWVHAASAFADVFGSAPKFDQLFNWWLNDEYVHVPGRKWYRPGKCSPAMEHYSYFEDKLGQSQYNFLEDEMQERFPLATSTGQPGKGFPWSVFMPVDNLGRYWYDLCGESGWYSYIGHVLHAIQDACIPHHAAGTMGNWHGPYEMALDYHMADWIDMGSKLEGRPILSVEQNFRERAMAYVNSWITTDQSPPKRLHLEDRNRQPAINWRVDHLITWIALHAFHEYATTYNYFRNGDISLVKAYPDSQSELTVKAIAMSTLILLKIQQEYSWDVFVANIRTKELHWPDCAFVGRMAPRNKYYLTMRASHESGYDGCAFCRPKPSRQ